MVSCLVEVWKCLSGICTDQKGNLKGHFWNILPLKTQMDAEQGASYRDWGRGCVLENEQEMVA